MTVEDVVMMGRFPRLGPVRRPGGGGPAGRRATPSPRSRWTTTCGPRSAACRAASGGASSSPARSPPSPTCSCSTSRSPGIDATTQEQLMDLLEAQAAAGQDGRRDHPRPGLRRRALPAGAGDQPDGRRPRPVATSCSTRRSSRPRTAATCSCSAAGRSSSTTPTTTTTRRPASATSTSGAALMDAAPRAARRSAFFIRALVASALVGRRVRGRRHVRRPARHRVHRRRHRPRGVPGRRRRVPARHPVLPRGGGRGGRPRRSRSGS